jgi:hypothetical protein
MLFSRHAAGFSRQCGRWWTSWRVNAPYSALARRRSYRLGCISVAGMTDLQRAKMGLQKRKGRMMSYLSGWAKYDEAHTSIDIGAPQKHLQASDLEANSITAEAVFEC